MEGIAGVGAGASHCYQKAESMAASVTEAGHGGRSSCLGRGEGLGSQHLTHVLFGTDRKERWGRVLL